jgi:uncharacterized paraquat-inducible protein A
MAALHAAMKYECGNCEAVFSGGEAKCQDWRIPEKSFICPSCDSALKKPRRDNLSSGGKASVTAILVIYLAAAAGLIERLSRINDNLWAVFISVVIGLSVLYAKKFPTKSRVVEPYAN